MPTPAPTPTLHLTLRSVVRAVVVSGAMVVLFVVATRATETLWWFAQAAVIAALAQPLVRRMSRHMPAFVAVLALTLAAALVTAGLAAVAMGELRTESQRFRDAVPGAVDRLAASEGVGSVIRDLGLEDSVRQVADEIVARARFDGPDLPGLATAVGGRISAGFVIWILAVMLVFTGPGLVRSLVDQAPAEAREQVATVLAQAYGRTIRYLCLTSLKAIAVAALAFTAATALGLDMPGVLAIVAGLLAFVPYVGILLGGLPVALMALLYGTGEAAAVLVAVLVLQVLDAVVVQRELDRRSLQLGLFPTLVAAMIGFHLHGPGGLLLGVAIAAMLVAVVNDTAAVRTLREAAHVGEGTNPPAPAPDAV